MPLNWTIAQFNAWVDTLFQNNTTREISEGDFRDGLKITAEYAEDVKILSQEAIDLFNQVYNPALNAASQAAASAAAAQALVTGAATLRPSIRPSLLLDFTGEVLDPRITYTRNDSNKSYFDQKGIMRMAKANEWPREYDPVTGKCLGRSVWESRTNNFAYSEQFDLWTIYAATITANTTIAPNGTLTADTLTENSANTAHYVSRGVNYVDTQPITVSCYMKAGTRTVGYISLYNGTATMNVYFNLTTGTVLSVNAALTASMVSVGNGWYRVACTYNSTVTATGGAAFGGSIIAAQTYQGDGASTIYLWGAQLETGNFATPYIPTTATTATRNADMAYIDGANFSEWFRADEWSMFAEFQYAGIWSVGNSHSVYAFTDGGLANYISAGRRASGTMLINGTGYATAQEVGSVALNTVYRTIQNYKAGSTSGGVNGVQIPDANNSVAFTPTQLRLWAVTGAFSTIQYGGYISCLAFYPKRLSNTEGLALTTTGLLTGKNPNQLPTVGDLGSAAFVQLRALLAMRNRQEFQILGTGTSQSYTIRRPYAFQFRTVDVPSGSTVTATPSTTVASSEDTDYTLTITVAVGKLFTYSITPIVP